MTIEEAYRRLEAVAPAKSSLTIQCDTWRHWDISRKNLDEVTTEFMVSWEPDGEIIRAKTLADAVSLVELKAKNTEPSLTEVNAFLREAPNA